LKYILGYSRDIPAFPILSYLWNILGDAQAKPWPISLITYFLKLMEIVRITGPNKPLTTKG
jgi:hypothetical protein